MNNIAIWLSLNTEEKLRIPVNPETIKMSATGGFEDVEVTQLGEYTFMGNPKLREFTFSSFFPRDYSSSYCESLTEFKEPWTMVEQLQAWMNGRKPVQLEVARSNQEAPEHLYQLINVPVTIRSFSYEERAGHVGDLFYDLTLKEYRSIEFKRLTPSDDGSVLLSEDTSRPDPAIPPESYEVRKGDTLWHIAQKTLGAGDQWPRIYELNQEVIGPNPNLIYPGQTLVIPQ